MARYCGSMPALRFCFGGGGIHEHDRDMHAAGDFHNDRIGLGLFQRIP